MQILLAFDSDDAGQLATLRAIPKLLSIAPRYLMAYEFLPGVVVYGRSLQHREKRIWRLRGRRSMDIKQLTRRYHPELRALPDWELELWIVNRKREVLEAELEGIDVPFTRDMLAVLEAERKRRSELQDKGGPKYDFGSESRQKEALDRVSEIKRYFRGDDFLTLFEQVTGIRPFPAGHQWKYACPLHGDGVDKTPAGSLDLDRGLWHCFACAAGGDVFHLLYAWPPHMIFREAVDELWSRMP